MGIRVRYRLRVQGRLKDPDGKWRDEMTQELEVESSEQYLTTETALKAFEPVAAAVREHIFASLEAAGGMVYNPNIPDPPETKSEIIGNLGDIEIVGDKILENCPVENDDLFYIECPIDSYDQMDPQEKASAELWLLNAKLPKRELSCQGCPKYQRWNTGLGTSPEVA